MRIVVTSCGNLADELGMTGHPVDLRCGGRGVCGRCGVRLLSGVWNVGGKMVTAPAEALACRTRLAGASGEIEVPDPVESGKIASAWKSLPLPAKPETVIGIDIGTTTLAAVKVFNGKIVGAAGCFNAQCKYGDNVVTRIAAAAAGLSDLQRAAAESVDGLLEKLGVAGVSRIAVAGNTVMSSLFHGIDPTPIGSMPFTPPVRHFPETRRNGIPLLTVPCVSGYVGGDLCAGLYETELCPGEMLVDIGTNCEIVYNTGSSMICSAAAAGPAFEGAGLCFGRRAEEGAIDRYRAPDDFSVIGGGEPRGLCGSAYIDFMAAERRTGRLDDMGRFTYGADRMQLAENLFVHERDVAQLLQAKAAVRAGILTLEAYGGHPAEKIYLAGGFARYLDLDSAIAVGMLPRRRYEISGNISLGGAARLAAAPEIMPELLALSDRPREIPLNTLAGFEDNFIDGLSLP